MLIDNPAKPSLPYIQPGKYRHYKGNEYEVIGVGVHTESLEPYVVYKSLLEEFDSKLWIRPYVMFTESVEVEGKTIARFVKIND